MKKRALSDGLLMTLVVVVINLIFAPGQPGWAGLVLHPYLFAVAALAVLHGLEAGLVFTAWSCLLMVVLSQFGPTPLGLLSILQAPQRMAVASWLAAASILGAASESTARRRLKLEQELRERDERMAVLSERARLLETENLELRGRLLGQPHSVATVYEMARGLTTLENEDLFESALSLVREHVGAEACSIYLQENDGRWKLRASIGRDDPLEALYLELESGLSGLAIKENRTVTFRELLRAESDPSVDAVLATPLRSENSVVGILLVERLPLERLTAQSVDTLELLAEWTSRAVQVVLRFSQAHSEGEEIALRRRFGEGRLSRSTLLTLAREPEKASVAVQLACEAEATEIGRYNAIHLLTLLHERRPLAVAPELKSLWRRMTEFGHRLRSLLKKLPLRDDLVGCSGLRYRLEEREAANRDSLLRLLGLLGGPTELEKSGVRKWLQGDGEQSEEKVLVALGLEAPGRDTREREEVLQDLCGDEDFWTRVCAARCAFELGHAGARERLVAGLRGAQADEVEAYLEALLTGEEPFDFGATSQAPVCIEAYERLTRTSHHV